VQLRFINTDGEFLPNVIVEITSPAKERTKRFPGKLTEFSSNLIRDYREGTIEEMIELLEEDGTILIFDKECILENHISRFPEKLVSRVKFESSKMQSED
jgi:hypothetical protein